MGIAGLCGQEAVLGGGVKRWSAWGKAASRLSWGGVGRLSVCVCVCGVEVHSSLFPGGSGDPGLLLEKVGEAGLSSARGRKVSSCWGVL